MKKLNVEHIYKRCNQMLLVKDGKDHPGYRMTTLACSIIKLTDNPDYSVLYRNDLTTEEQVQHMLESSATQNPASCQSFTNANPEGCMNCLENVRSPLLLANDYITLQLHIPEKVEIIQKKKKETDNLYPATEQEWLFDYSVRPSSTMQGVTNKVKVIANNKSEASKKFVKYISTTYGDILSLNFYIKDVPTNTPEVPAWLVNCNDELSEVGAPTLKEATTIYTNLMFDKYPNTTELSLTIRKMPEKIYINK